MSIAETIRKIIAKADSTAHPEEASVFMEKALRMMEAHGLSLLELGRLDSDNPVGVDMYFFESTKTTEWRQTLGTQLAKYFGCRLIVLRSKDMFGKTQNIYHSLAGRESARVTYQLMWPYVLRQVMKQAAEANRNGEYEHPSQGYKAVADALSLRLMRLNRDRAAAAPEQRGVNALVPVDLIQFAIDEAFAATGGTKKTAGKKVRVDDNAMSRASSISLHRQASADTAVRRIGSR